MGLYAPDRPHLGGLLSVLIACDERLDRVDVFFLPPLFDEQGASGSGLRRIHLFSQDE